MEPYAVNMHISRHDYDGKNVKWKLDTRNKNTKKADFSQASLSSFHS